MQKKVVFLIFCILFLTGCNSSKSQSTPQSQLDQTNSADSNAALLKNMDAATGSGNQNTRNVTPLTHEELAKHNNQNDCWLLINGKVYDVTSYIDLHPDREAIISGCGIDATTLYDTRGKKGSPHPPKADTLLEKYYLGKLIIQ